MRIEKLRFQNLNSLTGVWEIDFTEPAYRNNGIFAITGPTGAGKTTILDAICLALYGRTPRLERINKSSNEIMSRHTGSCFAEIVFATGSGEYCCHWSQQRARKKAEGELQPPKHEIADLRSGQILENRLRDVAAAVEQITGMSFIQFTRSMMLAQGGFAAFLQAPADERAPILEQITGTAIYSEISIRVHQRYSDKKKELELLQAATSNIKILTEAEEQEMEILLKTLNEQDTAGQAQLQTLTEALAWLTRLEEREQEVKAVKLQWKAFLARQEAFRPDEERLRLARQAVGLDGAYHRLMLVRRRQAEELAELNQLAAVIPAQRAAQKSADQAWRDAGQRLNEAKAARKIESETARQVREMDLMIRQLAGQMEQLKTMVATTQATCQEWQGKITAAEVQQQQMAANIAAATEYLQKNQRDETLLTKFSGIRRIFEQLRDKGEVLQQKQQEHHDWQTAGKEYQQRYHRAGSRHKENQEKLQQQIKLRHSLQRQMEEWMGSRDVKQWRDELERAKDYQSKLGEAHTRLAKIQDGDRELNSAREAMLTLVRQQQEITSVIKNQQILCEKDEREMELLEQQTALENRIRDLETERTRLEEGRPCPLCGATHHPYAQGHLPRLDKTTAALQQVREEAKQRHQELQALQLRLAGLTKETDLCRMALQKNEAELAQESEDLQQTIRSLPIRMEQPMSLPALQAHINQAEEARVKLAGQIKTIEDLQQQGEQASREYEETLRLCSQSEKELQQAQMQLEQQQKEQERLQREWQRISSELKEMRQACLLEVAEYGIIDLQLPDLSAILHQLEMRRDRLQEQQAEKQRLQNALDAICNHLMQYTIHLHNQQEIWQNDRQRLAQLGEEHARHRQIRLERYGDRDPDQEEARLEQVIAKAEAETEQTRQAREAIVRDLQRAEERSQMLADSTRQRADERSSLEHAFVEQLEHAGFPNENAYLQASVLPDELQQLSARAEQLAAEGTEMKTRLAERQENWQREKARQLSDQTAAVLEQEKQQIEQDLQALREQIGANKGILNNNRRLHQQLASQLQQIARQQEELRSWKVLHDLIGSADGKKFRNFAQGLTFEIMTGLANQQLRRMSDRYLLLRSPEQALGLKVIDNYQGGEIRSTANLSGGESFLVSLALALGLSQMASHKVSVDSLFLDEGFGALDEEALDTALNTLAGLQHEGKLIGVISHVPALKERISTQIQVISQAGGRSLLQGPGCRRVVSG
ncbi:MAG TPA: AAA family ATPase [Syntrophomonas sp.]|nr:AAA family ATPase [Syntrophomonas sp.]